MLGYLEKVKKTYKNIPQLIFTGYVKEIDVASLFTESALVIFPYTSTTGSSGVLHQAGSYGKAVVMPNLGDLTSLIEDEGYCGEFFEPGGVASLATAIKKIVTNEAYRIQLGKINYKAATAFPMERIAAIYLEEFHKIRTKKNTVKLEYFTSR
jgi:glycosyltransferase involved in cell wall biosynthesis